MSAISEQIYILLRTCVPYSVMFIFFILNTVSFSTPISTAIEIPFVIIVIYYWSIYRPTLMPPLLLFIIGICFDFLSGLPAGISSLIFLIIYQIVSNQRLFLMGQPFTVIWLGFAIVSFISFLIQWFLFGLINFQWTPLLPVILVIAAGILLFPVISFVLHLSHKVLPVLPDQYSAVK